jgi:hypothetical protein
MLNVRLHGKPFGRYPSSRKGNLQMSKKNQPLKPERYERPAQQKYADDLSKRAHEIEAQPPQRPLKPTQYQLPRKPINPSPPPEE